MIQRIWLKNYLFHAIYKHLFLYLYWINGFPFEFLSFLWTFSNSFKRYSIISLCSLVGSYCWSFTYLNILFIASYVAISLYSIKCKYWCAGQRASKDTRYLSPVFLDFLALRYDEMLSLFSLSDSSSNPYLIMVDKFLTYLSLFVSFSPTKKESFLWDSWFILPMPLSNQGGYFTLSFLVSSLWAIRTLALYINRCKIDILGWLVYIFRPFHALLWVNYLSVNIYIVLELF